MGILLHFLTYVCMVIFLFAVVAKFIQYKSMPLHVRWELYPVAHEGKKAHYGGSYFEETNWWTHERKPDRVSELRHMIPEMLFLVAVRKHNPLLWLRTFPFHFGMYILIGFMGLLCAGAAAQQMAGASLTAGGALFTLTAATGFAGTILGILGALGLLHRRLMDEDLKDFTKPADILNLLFLMAVFILILVSGISDNSFGGLTDYVRSVIFFDVAFMPGNAATAAAVVLGSLVVAYIPLTHMAHFVVKYFTYHNIRWDDTPNMRGSAHEKKIGEMLHYPCTWSAEHINPDGEQKSWLQVAVENPALKKEGK